MIDYFQKTQHGVSNVCTSIMGDLLGDLIVKESTKLPEVYGIARIGYRNRYEQSKGVYC